MFARSSSMRSALGVALLVAVFGLLALKAMF